MKQELQKIIPFRQKKKKKKPNNKTPNNHISPLQQLHEI